MTTHHVTTPHNRCTSFRNILQHQTPWKWMRTSCTIMLRHMHIMFSCNTSHVHVMLTLRNTCRCRNNMWQHMDNSGTCCTACNNIMYMYHCMTFQCYKCSSCCAIEEHMYITCKHKQNLTQHVTTTTNMCAHRFLIVQDNVTSVQRNTTTWNACAQQSNVVQQCTTHVHSLPTCTRCNNFI